MTIYFDDQPKVPGADVIYRPAGEAGEYAPLATNPYKGCGHACKYCYVPLAMRDNYLPRLERDVARYRAAGICNGHSADQIFVTFSSDPWHPGDVSPTIEALTALAEGGMSFCTLTKGGMKAWTYRALFRPVRDAFAATLTTLDDDFSRMWEPGAPLPTERVEALRRFRERGVFTWVSLEPTLDVEASLEIVRATHGFVDLYKIGKANYLKEITRTTNWSDYTLRMIDLCQKLGARHYIKRSLQEHLPEGYVNPLRVPQHH